MAKVVALYKNPKNAEAFDKHYSSVHIPLAKKIPGLKKSSVKNAAFRLEWAEARRSGRRGLGTTKA
jgi:uncharacterized protein (TIGR02118 family)